MLQGVIPFATGQQVFQNQILSSAYNEKFSRYHNSLALTTFAWEHNESIHMLISPCKLCTYMSAERHLYTQSLSQSDRKRYRLIIFVFVENVFFLNYLIPSFYKIYTSNDLKTVELYNRRNFYNTDPWHNMLFERLQSTGCLF